MGKVLTLAMLVIYRTLSGGADQASLTDEAFECDIRSASSAHSEAPDDAPAAA